MQITTFKIFVKKPEVKAFLKGYKTNFLIKLLSYVGFGNDIITLSLRFYPIYKALVEKYEKEKYVGDTYIFFDGFIGEFIYYNDKFYWSNGIKYIYKLPELERKIMCEVLKNFGYLSVPYLERKFGNVRDTISQLSATNLLKYNEEEDSVSLGVNIKYYNEFDSCLKVPTEIHSTSEIQIQKVNYQKDRLKEFCYDLLGWVVKHIEIIYMPVYVARIRIRGTKEFYHIFISAFNKQVIHEIYIDNDIYK